MHKSAFPLIIRPIDQLDHAQWVDLYKGYISFYQRAFDEQKIITLWQWIKERKILGLVVEQEGKLIALAHYREMLSPLNGFAVGFLDDFFIAPEYRGQDTAKQLMQALKEQAEQRGWPFIRWITKDNNYRAKAFYDKIAIKTDWNTYQIDC